MMNQISDNLIFTMQTSEDFPDNKLTTLDTTVCVENNTIQYAFNEKEVPAKTRIPENIKISSLTEYVICIPVWSYQTQRG